MKIGVNNLASKKLTVTIQPDLGRVNEFERIANPYKDSLMVSFDILDDKNVSMEYVKKTNSNAGDNDKDYCFAGLMFSKETGMFYAYPDSIRTFIPLLDGRKYFKEIAKKTLGIDVKPHESVLDGLFQSVKLATPDGKGGKVGNTPSSAKESIETMLSEVISYYSSSSKQRTVIGKLLYNEYGGTGKEITKEEAKVFYCDFAFGIASLAEAYNKVLASVKNRTTDGMVNTNLNVQSAIKEVFENPPFQLLKMDAESKTNDHIQELSANFFFNPTVREYFENTFDRKGKPRAASNKAYKQLSTVTFGMNAADLMTDPSSGIITALGQFSASGVDSEYENDYSLDSVAPNGASIMKAGDIEKLIKVYDGNADSDIPTAVAAIQSIEDSGETLENPAIYVLTDRAIRAMTELLKAMNSQTLKKK